MSDGTIWDEVDTGGASASWVKLENDGDEVSGVITSLRTHTFPATVSRGATTVPVVGIDGAEWTASNMDARAKLVAARPRVGDWIRVKRTGSERNKHGGKTVLFDVETRPAGGPQRADEAPF